MVCFFLPWKKVCGRPWWRHIGTNTKDKYCILYLPNKDRSTYMYLNPEGWEPLIYILTFILSSLGIFLNEFFFLSDLWILWNEVTLFVRRKNTFSFFSLVIVHKWRHGLEVRGYHDFWEINTKNMTTDGELDTMGSLGSPKLALNALNEILWNY